MKKTLNRDLNELLDDFTLEEYRELIDWLWVLRCVSRADIKAFRRVLKKPCD